MPLKRLELTRLDNSNQSDIGAGEQVLEPERAPPRNTYSARAGEHETGEPVDVIRLNQDEPAEFVCRALEGKFSINTRRLFLIKLFQRQSLANLTNNQTELLSR